MSITINREKILGPVTSVLGVVERKQTMPILSNILININKNKLSVTSSDLEVELIATEKLESQGELLITVPGRKFADIIRSLPMNQEIYLEIDADRLKLKAGRARFTVLTQPAEDFPLIEKPQSPVFIEVPQDRLRELIRKTHFAMAQNDVRYYLNGLRFEYSNQVLRAVATDGHRLSVGTITLSSQPISGDSGEKAAIVPRKGILELERLMGDGEQPIRMAFASNHLCVECGNLSLTTKLIEGRYPDYSSVIPKESRHHVVVDRNHMKEALSRAAILANEKIRGVRLGFETKSLRMVGHNAEQEEAEDVVETNYEGDAFEVGFNVTYLLDVLNAVTESEIEILINDPNSSCRIDPKGNTSFQYVIMPMRL
jgi:DNA polymerase-3 subunit beta